MHPRRHQGARNRHIGEAMNALKDKVGPKAAQDGKVDQLERQTRVHQLVGRTHSRCGDDGSKEAPGLAQRGSKLKAKFQKSVAAVRAGQVIVREGLATIVKKPGISEIAHVKPFRVVKTHSINHMHANKYNERTRWCQRQHYVFIIFTP